MAFPNVPNLPGVPILPRAPGALFAAVSLLVTDALGLLPLFATQQWGIFLDGAAVVNADTVLAVDFRQDWTVADYLLENGAFETYDKVENAFDVRVRMAAGGSLANRQAFIDSVDAIAPLLTLYDVVTPEKVFIGVTIQHIAFERKADRLAGIVVIDLFLREVRDTVTAQFSNTPTTGTGASISGPGNITSSSSSPIGSPQSANAFPQVSGGVVQPAAPTAAQLSAVQSVLAQSSLPF